MGEELGQAMNGFPGGIPPDDELIELLYTTVGFYRLMLRSQCEELSPEQLAAHPIPSSRSSILDVVRCLTESERRWQREADDLFDEAGQPVSRVDRAQAEAVLLAWYEASEESRREVDRLRATTELEQRPRHALLWALLRLLGVYSRCADRVSQLRAHLSDQPPGS